MYSLCVYKSVPILRKFILIAGYEIKTDKHNFL